MIIRILIVNLVVLFIFMSLAYLVAKSRNRIDTVDVCWGLGFIVAACSVQIQEPSNRSLAVTILVSIWGFRLASHIYSRHKSRNEDPRYKEITSKWQGSIWPQAYVYIFLLQGVLIWIVSLPVVMFANNQLDNSQWLVGIGLALWVLGFAFEVIADRQLQYFLKQKNHPKVLQTGLWRYSRHPNYFGELTQWWGIGVMALSASYGWIGLFGPLTLSYLMIFVSGIPPIERRRAKEPEYQEYARRTSSLIPLPPSK